jgi:hypothetical protein
VRQWFEPPWAVWTGAPGVAPGAAAPGFTSPYNQTNPALAALGAYSTQPYPRAPPSYGAFQAGRQQVTSACLPPRRDTVGDTGAVLYM